MDSMCASFDNRLKKKLKKFLSLFKRKPTRGEIAQLVASIVKEDVEAAETSKQGPIQAGTRTFLGFGQMRYGCK
ncbi:MAG TPA: hypothetical protein P5232_02840 [Candidatus Moranbacteria bacterium]|nr:hypothetical protein [Candidatus Moranbacteria bacterium]